MLCAVRVGPGLRLTFILALALAGSGCGGSLLDVPLTSDREAPPPREYFELAKRPTAPACDPPIQIVRDAAETGRPYRELATISASCYPGTPAVCEARLKERACELHADAIILLEAQKGGSPPGASHQPQIVSSARAVRWEE